MDRIQPHFNTITLKDPHQQTDISRHFKQNDLGATRSLGGCKS